MSKIISGEKNNTCEPWQAPRFRADSQQIDCADLRSREKNEQIRKQAYETGFSQGHKEGTQQGQIQIHEIVSNLESIISTLAAPLQDLDEQVITELSELAMLVAGHIVRRELKTSPGEVVATVKEALSLLPIASGNVRLELHPEDATTVRDALSGVETEQSWDVVEDPLMTRGGCRVATNTSRIDATVENRLNAAIASVLGCERKLDRET